MTDQTARHTWDDERADQAGAVAQPHRQMRHPGGMQFADHSRIGHQGIREHHQIRRLRRRGMDVARPRHPGARAPQRAGRRPTQAELYSILAVNRAGDYGVLLAAGGIASGALVVPLVERCLPAIHKLARKLVADGVARHRDVTSALGLSADPTTAALELAHIRAGAAPGSFTVTQPVSARLSNAFG